jgi:hypothetical protein
MASVLEECKEYEKKCDELEKGIKEVLDTTPPFVYCDLIKEHVPPPCKIDGSVTFTITVRVGDVPFNRVSHTIIVCENVPNKRMIKYVRNCVPHWVGQIYEELVKEEMEKRAK